MSQVRSTLYRLDTLAIIQPRGLSPSDNVALDKWVRDGGRLLLVLDPMLTGHYELPLGDPRRPSDVALIPPVVARWGLEIVFDDAQPVQRRVAMPFGEGPYDLSFAGEVRVLAANSEGDADECALHGEAVMAVCDVGKGTVTLVADAGVFEHGSQNGSHGSGEHDYSEDAEEHGEILGADGGKQISDLIAFAFSR